MSVLQSIFLGIVQGLTEFLPVSSSGHLAIIQNFFKIDTGSSILFDILLHLGTLLVVFIVYWKDIWKLILEALHMLGDIFANLGICLRNKKAAEKTRYRKIVRTNYRKFVVLLIVSTIPTGIIGILGEKLIQKCFRYAAGTGHLSADHWCAATDLRQSSELLQDPQGCYIQRGCAGGRSPGAGHTAGAFPFRNYDYCVSALRI